ncbi:MAG: FtsQ-type POTRA domain-containing protein [Bacilli bacterium]|nr:FtsQ-type POTRA domain-containing protein [Bacilli bacterium]
MATTVKVKKKRLKIKTIIMFLLIIVLIVYLFFFIFSGLINTKIKNIYIIGNDILKDDEIITLAKIENYPKILSITSNEMERRIKTNPYIKSVDVKKKFGSQVYVYIEEYLPLFYNITNNKLVLENEKQVLLEETFNDIPILINFVTDENVYKRLMDKFVKINDDIKQKISEIKYDPNEVDKERFLFTMNDGNYVYITLAKINEINYYMDILPTLENKKGILYLDSGKYFQIFE